MVRLELETSNAAFGESHEERRAEIARILRSLANKVERGGAPQGRLFDVNGNAVGTYDLTAAPDKLK